MKRRIVTAVAVGLLLAAIAVGVVVTEFAAIMDRIG